MEKLIITAILLLISFLGYAQYFVNGRIQPKDSTFEWFVIGTNEVTMKTKLNSYANFKQGTIQFQTLDSTKNDGTPSRALWVDNRGRMKTGALSALIATVVTVSSVTNALGANPVMKHYTTTGTITPVTKMWTAVVSPSITNNYTISISSASFTTIASIQILASRSTTIASASPNVSIVSYNTSQIVVNVTESSTSLVTILGIGVLGGLPIIFASTTGLSLHVTVLGN